MLGQKLLGVPALLGTVLAMALHAEAMTAQTAPLTAFVAAGR